MKKLWSCIATLTCASFVTSCSDDDTNGNDSTRDAAIDSDTASSNTGASSTGNSTSTTVGTSNNSTSTGAVRDAGNGGGADGGGADGGGADGGEANDGGATDDAEVDGSTADGGLGDADVFSPDGGVVLRPTELPFSAESVDDLSVPEGFTVNVFANVGGKTRMLAPYGGSMYVTRPEQGDVLRLADMDDDGVAEVTATAVSGYTMVHGITFVDDTVYLATPTELIRGTVGDDGTFGALETLIDDLPDGGQHPLRTLGIGPDGALYLSIGSSCDACAETNPEHATLLRVALDGSSRSIFASGLRNTIGFGWHPDTDQLWGMDNGSDWRGNELPPEELNHIEQGGDYGWPYCYAKKAIDPIIADPPDTTKAAYCEATLSSVLENQAHEAPIGMVFYDGMAFPSEYQGSAFVAMHGSWNRNPATGYKIVRVVFEDGQPTNIEDFVTGFLNEEGTATFGRPAGVAVDGEGALLFSDDSNGVVYRVSIE